MSHYVSLKEEGMHNNDHQLPLDNDYLLMIEYLSGSDSSQTYAAKEALKIMGSGLAEGAVPEIVDLGCGAGNGYDDLQPFARNFNWIGLDIEISPEVNERKRTDLTFMTYNGIDIPFPDNSKDLIYSRQVFEHVLYPQELLREVYRVLKPGGYFVGSTSHLEPFHSRSLWNFTPYGFVTLLKRAGFTHISIRPGIDCVTLIMRRLISYFGMSDLLNPFFKFESPLNMSIELTSRILRIQKAKVNFLKLLYSGHFIFVVKKQECT